MRVIKKWTFPGFKIEVQEIRPKEFRIILFDKQLSEGFADPEEYTDEKEALRDGEMLAVIHKKQMKGAA